MTTAIVLHRVTDYETWRPAYDGLDNTRRTAGVTHHEVLRSEDDPNLVIIRHDFANRATADAFFANTELKEAMANGGVEVSTLQIHLAAPA